MCQASGAASLNESCDSAASPLQGLHPLQVQVMVLLLPVLPLVWAGDPVTQLFLLPLFFSDAVHTL